MDTSKVILYPVSTEKGIKLMETENKLIFVVDGKATKREIRKAVEQAFNIKVTGVNTFINQGKKRAYVTIDSSTPAINIATQMGLI